MKKICAKCGKEIDDANAFCPYCGTGNAAAQPAAAGSGPAQKRPDKAAVLKIVIPAAAVLVLGLCIFLAVRNMPVTLKLSDYTSLSVEGYNGMASARVDFDSEAFNGDVLEAMRKKGTDRLLNGTDGEDTIFNSALLGDFLISSFADELVSWDLNKSSGISNGDDIELTFRCDNDSLENFKIRLEGNSMSLTAEGLPEIGVIDPFEGLEVTFSGIEPNGRASVSGGDSRLDYRVEQGYELSNGETVKVTVSYRAFSEEEFADTYGEIASPLEKTYTVEGLETYLSSFDQLTDAFLETLDKQSLDVIAQSISDNSQIEQNQYTGADRTGMYLLTKKKGSYALRENKLVLVYTVHYKIGEKTGDYFFPVAYNDILILNDGKISTNVMDYEKPSGSYFFGPMGDMCRLTDEVYAVGYDSIDQIFHEYVTTIIENYNYEEQFPKEKE